MAKALSRPPQDKIALYEKLVATNPAVECKGDSIPYTSLNGNMFSMLSQDGSLALRLSPEAREEFIRKYKAKLQETHGVVRKEYVVVPAALLAKTSELKKYFDLSYEYAKSLKPKPTKRKK